MDDKLLMVPLVTKELSDARYCRIIKWLIIIIIICNLAWSSTWIIHTLTEHTDSIVITEEGVEQGDECKEEEERLEERRYTCMKEDEKPEII